MVRNRIRRTNRGKFDEATMKAAVLRVVNEDWSVRSAAEDLKINHMTLQRYVKKYKETREDDRSKIKFSPSYTLHCVFTTAMEEELKDHLLLLSKTQEGLTRKLIMSLAYQLAILHKTDCPPSWHENKIVGVDWYYNFMKRWPIISLSKPVTKSIASSPSYKWSLVNSFFKNLEEACQQLDNLSPDVIYNLDETILTTVHKPENEMTDPQTNEIELGVCSKTVVTACCCISASGQSVPPFLIFPKTNFKAQMLFGAPAGTATKVHESGWLNDEIFIDILQHFQNQVHASITNKILLILDNRPSHITIKSLNFCKKNGIILLINSSQMSHKLQPLHQTVYDKLKQFLIEARNNSDVCNTSENTLSIYNIASLFGKCYPLAFSQNNIIQSFNKTGIWPYNPNLLADEEFLNSCDVDEPRAVTSDSSFSSDMPTDSLTSAM